MVGYLFKEFNAGLQVHAKVYGGPLNAFFFVFLLFQQERLLVVKLLQLFITVVDAELFEPIDLRMQRCKLLLRTWYENVL